MEGTGIEDQGTQDPRAAQDASTDLGLVLDLAREAYPDAVPELIGGETVEEIVGSVEAARAAYTRIAGEVASREAAKPPRVPAGGAPMGIVDVESLPAAEKVRRALAARGR
jgi:hypothetical protein